MLAKLLHNVTGVGIHGLNCSRVVCGPSPAKVRRSVEYKQTEICLLVDPSGMLGVIFGRQQANLAATYGLAEYLAFIDVWAMDLLSADIIVSGVRLPLPGLLPLRLLAP